MVTGLLMALSAMFIVMQLPGKRYWVEYLWAIDSLVFAGVFYLTIVVRSTDVTVAAAVAGVTFTVLLKCWRAIWTARFSR